jgi:hypothetical protein
MNTRLSLDVGDREMPTPQRDRASEICSASTAAVRIRTWDAAATGKKRRHRCVLKVVFAPEKVVMP